MAALWRPVPGRLQSVSVADKDHIWGVTLDFQLCKFNPQTKQWQLVSVTTESLNRARISASSNQSTQSSASTLSFATKNASTPGSPAMTRANSTSSILGADAQGDTTIQVSAASDGTVVRLDRSLKSWYLIAPQNHSHVDYEKGVIWIDLGHFWKCVSVASISQIWGLSDCGDIYYGTSDRFALLEHAITSGAGYSKPAFTHISVGHDNVVLATDAHSGTVFRLKLHPTGACPPVWTALSGTGPGSSSLHIVNCSLSAVDFIVGVAKDGRVYRYSHSDWVPLGGGAKLDNVGVGIDGYVLGVDRDGDLFGCQLESTTPVVPLLERTWTRDWPQKVVKDGEQSVPGSPQAPNAPSLLNTPRQQGMSRSPRELFELASTSARESASAQRSRFPAGESSVDTSKRRMPGFERSNSQTSKRSYASDMARPKTPTGLILSQPSTPILSPPPQSQEDNLLDSTRKAPTTPGIPTKSPLRIKTKGMSASNLGRVEDHGDSYFTSKPITTIGPRSDLSPLTSFPLDGNPYAAGSKPSSNHSAVHTPITPQSDNIISTSSRLLGSYNLLSIPSHHSITSPNDAVDEVLSAEVVPRVDGSTPLPSSTSSSDNNILSGASPATVRSGVMEHQRAGGEANVESSQGLSSPAIANGSGIDVELTDRLENRDIHREHPSAAVGYALEVDARYTLPPPLSSPPALFHQAAAAGVVPSSLSMDVNRLDHDKGEWVEGANGLGDDVTMGVNLGGQEVHREGDADGGYVWNHGDTDDTGVRDPRPKKLGKDKKEWCMPLSHLEPSASTSFQPLRPSSRTPPFSTEDYHHQQTAYFGQQQDHYTNGQPRTPSFFYWNKQELGESDNRQYQDPSNPDYLQAPHPDLLSQHRPSDTSEVLMLQQQEFLRQTRLRSQPSSVVIENDPHLRSLSEKSEVLLQDPLTTTSSFSSDHPPQGQPQYQDIPPSDDNSESEEMPRKNKNKNKNKNQNQKRRGSTFFSTTPLDDDDDPPSRHSYSSLHLQNYLDTLATNPMNNSSNSNNNSNNNSRMSLSIGMRPLDINNGGIPSSANPANNAGAFNLNSGRTPYKYLVGPERQISANSTNASASASTSTGGIQGEDAHGRWVGSPTATDPRVAIFDPSEVKKSRCCIIL
ncbi:hypothetical protein BGX23_004430 [Mortierella sp. AD031]|nr:hypothetical protein BGX23_004430 [Mortierella sp. AD031]